MDLPENLRYLAETLVPPKPGIIVGIATERLIAGGSVPESAYEQLCVPEWRAFCHAVYPGQVFPKDDPLVEGQLETFPQLPVLPKFPLSYVPEAAMITSPQSTA